MAWKMIFSHKNGSSLAMDFEKREVVASLKRIA